MTAPNVRKLLIVDDDPIARRAIARTLDDKDFEILQADSPSQALQIMQTQPIRVVIADQHMRCGETGTDFLSVVESRWPDTIRFLLTSDTSTETFVAAINGGKTRRVLYKPWQDEQLLSVVRQAFGLPKFVKNPRVYTLTEPSSNTLTKLKALFGVTIRE